MTRRPPLVVVGGSGGSHIGASLIRAAQSLSIDSHLCDIETAWRHGTLLQKLLWHFFGRRPVALNRFGRKVIRECRSSNAEALVTTGNAPVPANTLAALRRTGVKCLNFSTDDPFNPRQRAPWFLAALREYDAVFTPRRANVDEFRRHGCHAVHYLPFGYDPDLFFAEATDTNYCEAHDLLFAGTADAQRVPYIAAAIDAGFAVRLHGIYWDRFQQTRKIALGQADVPTLRIAIASCKVSLCLVRHENRDGHSMRSFEIPPVGACMLVEDTLEHREIFGSEGECVIYFSNPTEMLQRCTFLLSKPPVRGKMAAAVQKHVVEGRNTYADRLESMLQRLLI